MINKYVIFYAVLVSFYLLPVFTMPGHAQPSDPSSDEISRTLDAVKRRPTDSRTFDKRAKILETWFISSIASGHEGELRQIAPPGLLQNILILRQNGRDEEAFKMLDDLFMKMEAVGIAAPAVRHAATQTAPVTAYMTVDYSRSLGAFGNYIFGATADPRFNRSEYPLVSDAGFRMIEVTAPPMPPRQSDITDPSSYDFTILDRQVESLVNVGVKPLLWFPLVRKPDNPDNYAAYVKNVVRHLNNDQWNGHAWDVTVFRFGNEPDNQPFWNGTQQEFFEAYGTAAKALKKLNSNYVLVTGGLMMGVVNNTSNNAYISSWVTNFLAYAKRNNVPIDIFSMHAYSGIPYYLFYNNFRLLKTELQKYPTLSNLYGSPLPGNDEWNILLGDLWSGSYHKQFDTAWTASHSIAALINMIEQGVSLSVPMTGTSNRPEPDCHDILLVDCKLRGKPSYYAFKGFNSLYGNNRLYTTGTDHMNFAAIAGGSANSITIVFSNYDVANYLNKYERSDGPSAWPEYEAYVSRFGVPRIYNGFSMTLNNLPWTSGNVVYEHYLVDDTHKLELIDSVTLKGNSNLSFSGGITAPSVHVIRLYPK
ncbi:MAG: hypothetical protein HQL08_02430 [Nitrospirae bacterium]|nr:hypothetical protein [Nitrospirota bacterium]